MALFKKYRHYARFRILKFENYVVFSNPVPKLLETDRSLISAQSITVITPPESRWRRVEFPIPRNCKELDRKLIVACDVFSVLMAF